MPAPKGHEPYNKNGEGGRPLRYTKEFIEAEADALEEWLEKGKFLWFEKFAYERGYPDSKLSIWAKENDRFRDAYHMALTKQKSMLVEGSLAKKMNYNMAQLLLGHYWAMVPKQENKISGDAKDPLSVIMTVVNDDSRDLIDNAE